MHIVTVILTIPQNLKFAKQTKKHLQKHKFHKPLIIVCPSAMNQGYKSIHLNICKNHLNVIKWFIKKKKMNHLLICEDDCEMMTEKVAYPQIEKQLEFLDRHHPEWITFHIGHCPLGPIFPTDHAEIVRTTLPHTSHCYVMNGKHLSNLLTEHPNENDWIRPQAIEGWTMLPWKSKFAAFPTLATQNREPKELVNTPLIRHVSFTNWIVFTEQVMMYIVPVTCFILIVIVLVRIFKKLNQHN